MANKITIIDGNSLLFRAYFATAYGGGAIMCTKEGIHTNAIFAFSNMMIKILNSIKQGEALIVAFDHDSHTFRKEEFEEYKANRKPAPSELIEQFPIAREFLNALGVFQCELHGYEADDIAGTVAKMAEKQGYEVNIYTSDRDYLQLVTDKTTLSITKKGLSDIALMTPETVKETYGFEPLQVIDYKGLRGDPSDNLPGIPGIGDKTAVKLIQEYGSFDEIIKNAANIKGKLGQSIQDNAKIGTMCRDLAIINTEVPLEFDIKDTIYEGYDFNEMSQFAVKYELKTFMNKVPSKWKKVNTLEMDIQVKEVKTFKDIEIGNKIGLALDIDNDDYYDADILGAAITDGKDTYYINYEDFINDDYFKQIIENVEIKKHVYFAKSIEVALAKKEIYLNGVDFDLLIAAYVLDSGLSTASISNVMAIFGVDVSKDDDNVSLLDPRQIKSTAKIAMASLALKDKIFKELDKVQALKLYQDVELPLSHVLAKMEIEGFPLNKEVLDGFSKEFKQKLETLTAEIYDLAGCEFNIASPKQIGEVLFEKLGLPNIKKGSTSVEVLKELLPTHPIIEKIMDFRKYSKLVSTYTEGLKNYIREDGKIHAIFNQAQTTTGRLSSSNPNLQNISIRDEEGKMIRTAFFYPNNEYEILSLDYSQIELRILAALSNCTPMLDIFKSGKDIHSETARLVFKCDGDPTDLQRRKAKAVNFGIIYGISDWGLMEQIGGTVKHAREIIDNFFGSFPEIQSFLTNIVIDAQKNGYVSTLFGRRRYLKEIYDSNYQKREFAKRAAMNAPIQGTAADLIKMVMIKVDEALLKNNLKTRIVSQIHDELIFKVPIKEKETAYNLIKNIMENEIELPVKLEVDGGFGKTWYEAK